MRSRFVSRVLTTALACALIGSILPFVPAAAGTTGGFAGTVTDSTTHAPLAGAAVTLASPSQTAKTTTDRRGHFAFVSLAPDTYVLSVDAAGYDPIVQNGVTVAADQFPTATFGARTRLREIGRTASRSSADLVKPGQTSDVYSVSGQQVQNAQGLGGGGALFQTYAALSSVPGVYVPQNGTNQGQNNSGPFIRGGNFTQVGQEYDGIPITRAYDSYVGNTQGITGQQELQVYTGGGPASSPSESLAGSINQVVKTGTLFAPSMAASFVADDATFTRHLRDAPDDIAAGLKTIAQTTADFGLASLEAGAEGVFYGVKHASGRVLPHAEYALLDTGFDRPVAKALHERSSLTIVHIHGGELDKRPTARPHERS